MHHLLLTCCTLSGRRQISSITGAVGLLTSFSSLLVQ
jgi:succinate-acetate transporter protein